MGGLDLQPQDQESYALLHKPVRYPLRPFLLLHFRMTCGFNEKWLRKWLPVPECGNIVG